MQYDVTASDLEESNEGQTQHEDIKRMNAGEKNVNLLALSSTD